MIGDVRGIRLYKETDGIELDTISQQTVNSQISIHSRYRRNAQVDICILETIALTLQKFGKEVGTARRKINICCWQILTECLLVNLSIFDIFLHVGHQTVHLFQQLFIASLGICTQMEVAAIKYGMGGIAAGKHIEHHIVRTVYIRAVADGDVAHKSLHLIIVLQVGGYVQMQTGRNGQRLVSQS